MTKQFKVGDKVRVIKEFCEHNVGKIAVINRYDPRDDVYTYGFESGGWIDSESIELVDSNPSNSERITVLETQVAELQAELQALRLGKQSVYTSGILADALETFAKASKPSPNEQRKAVIERAKAFVLDVSEKAEGDESNDIGNVIYRHRTTRPEFHVNEKKRTVAVLLKGAHTPYLIGKGIAKCAPGDVFNADIGKAIALGRALGLDVSEFENAPKPTEVVVGHITEVLLYESIERSGEYCEVVAINSKGLPLYSDGMHASHYVITDDTEAQYV